MHKFHTVINVFSLNEWLNWRHGIKSKCLAFFFLFQRFCHFVVLLLYFIIVQNKDFRLLRRIHLFFLYGIARSDAWTYTFIEVHNLRVDSLSLYDIQCYKKKCSQYHVFALFKQKNATLAIWSIVSFQTEIEVHAVGVMKLFAFRSIRNFVYLFTVRLRGRYQFLHLQSHQFK